MIRVGDLTVTWEELFFFVRGNINGVLMNFGEIYDWDELLSADLTLGGFIMQYSVEDALLHKALEYGAKSKMEPASVVIEGNVSVPVRIAFVYGLAGEVIEFMKEG